MQSSVYVTASGPALSLLLYENTKTPGYQMGFLLGAVVNQVTDTISDSQIRGEKTETIINISSILPIPSSYKVINGAGKIDKEKLSAIVKAEKEQQLRCRSQSHDIVGWYSFKRNSIFQMSMREHVVHLQLAEMAKHLSQDSTPELFVLGLLANNLTSQATHVFKHSFMRYLSEKSMFDIIPLQIHNLGMDQATQYQNTACAPSRATLLKELFDRTSPQAQGKDHMLLVQSELQVLLNQRVGQLSNAENCRIKLEHDVELLKKELQKLKNRHQVKRRGMTDGQNNGLATFEQEHSKLDNPNNQIRSVSNPDEEGTQDCHSSTEPPVRGVRTSPVLGKTRRILSRPSTPASRGSPDIFK